MMGMQGYNEGMTAFYALALGALVVLVSLASSLIAIFSESTGREARTRRIVGLWGKRTAIVIILALAASYWAGARQRSKATGCDKVPSNSGRYVAELCLLQWNPSGNSDYLGRVYEAKTGKLLARREFSSPVPELSWWKDESLSFERGGDDSSRIKLPPSLYDRLLAELPW